MSSAKDMVYLFRKADGPQVTTMYWAGELDVHANVRGWSCRTEEQRKWELSALVFRQSVLSAPPFLFIYPFAHYLAT